MTYSVNLALVRPFVEWSKDIKSHVESFAGDTTSLCNKWHEEEHQSLQWHRMVETSWCGRAVRIGRQTKSGWSPVKARAAIE